MNKLIIALLTLSLFSCSQKNHQSDELALNAGSIVNGEQVQPGQWQSVVSLQTSGQSFCTGNLVDENTVYSAAHCFISGPKSQQEANYIRTALINASKQVLPEGQDVLNVDQETALKVLMYFFDVMAKQQASYTTINFGVGKREGQNHKIKTVRIEEVKIHDSYKKFMIAGLFPEIKFSAEEMAEIAPRTAQDIAIVTLKESVQDITPIPLISNTELAALQVGQEIILTGYGAKVDPILIYYVYQTIVKNNQLFDEEADDQKREQLRKDIDELIEFYNQANQLSQSESDKNSIVMKISSIQEKTIEVVDTKSGQEAGACHGDSGGPAFIQLANGEWRQFATIAQKNPLCHLGNLLMKVSQD